MGTYSYFRLEIMDKNTVLKGEAKHHIIEDIYADNDIDPHGFARDAIDLDGQCNGEAKWYDAQTHVAKVSKNHPELIFILGQELCCPESEDEEGEWFYAIHNGDARSIHEPSFMKKITLFNSREELQDAAMVMETNDYTDIVFKSKEDQKLDLIFEKLKNSSFKEHTEKTFTLMSFGGSGSSVTVRIRPEQIDAFWTEAENVLIV